MKPVNTLELDSLIAEISQTLVGAETQSLVGSFDDIITFKFWSKGLFCLCFSLKSPIPFFVVVSGTKHLDQKHLVPIAKKPFSIFYKTHFKGLELSRIERLKDYGRLVRFYFGDDHYIEVRLFPGGVNLGLFAKGKEVFVKKPLELVKLESDYKPDSIRSPAVLLEQALEKIGPDGVEAKSTKTVSVEKKEIAKQKISEALDFLKKDKYKIFSELLEQGLPLTKELQSYYKENLSLRENIEWGFEQQKQKKLKIERLTQRLESLEKDFSIRSQEPVSRTKALDVNNLKATRHLQISEEVRAFCGKTATENLDLLRKSRSWHIWMHLKDYPSGHLILATPKNYAVSEDELKESALFLFKVAAPKKLQASEQISFEVIYTETKFVKPIKGAKKGLVQPSRTRSRIYLWKRFENLI